MLFTPAKAWEQLAARERHWAGTFFSMLLPLLVVTGAIEGWALINLEQPHEAASVGVRIPAGRVQKYLILYAAFSLAIVFLGAYFLNAVAQSFNVRTNYSQAFLVVAYAYAPILLAHLLDAIPVISTWICWGVGLAFAFGVLYHGIGVGLKPEQTKGFGLLLFSLFYITVLSGLSHFALTMVLKGVLWREVEMAGRAAGMPI